MNAYAVTQMKIIMARLEQLWPFGRTDLLFDSIFEDSDQVSLYMPDLDIDCKGKSAVLKALKSLKAQTFGQFHLFHTPSEYTDETTGEIYGHWNTYTYTLSRDQKTVQFSFWRFWVHCVRCDDDTYRIRRLSVMELLHMKPLDYDSQWEPALFDGTSAAMAAEGRASASAALSSEETAILAADAQVLPWDYVQIRNLLNRFVIEEPKDQWKWMEISEEMVYEIPYLTSGRAKGTEAVQARLRELQVLEDANGNLYPWKVMDLTEPALTMEDGKLSASCLALVFQFRGKAWGIGQIPYPLHVRIGRMTFGLSKSEEWRISSVTYRPYINLSPQDYDERTAPRTKTVIKKRLLPEAKAPRNNRPEDVFILESILVEWIERLKRGELEDFVDNYMVNSQEEIVLHFSEKYTGYDAVKKRAYDMVRGILKGREYLYKYPQCHNGGMPVIEISDDGLHAEGVWIDYCWGNIGVAVFYDEDCINRQYYPGGGVYYCYFIKDHGTWKLYHFCSKNDGLLGLPLMDYEAGNSGGWSSSKTTKAWPLPFEDFHY